MGIVECATETLQAVYPVRVTRDAKSRWRRRLRARLAALDPAEAARSAAAVAERTLALPEVARARRVFTCLSFGDELDTRGLVERLLDDGREVYVPRTEAGDPQIHVHRYPCELRTLSFGLRQPRPDQPEVPPSAVDATLGVALVLGLGFDRRGIRLGYGRGYFDRFLAGRPFPAVGLCYDLQLVDRLPSEGHDVPMAVVVTGSEVVRRTGGS